jgi:hypothetical protein
MTINIRESFGLPELGLSWLIPTYLLSHNTTHSTSRALFIESAEQTRNNASPHYITQHISCAQHIWQGCCELGPQMLRA